MIYFKSRASDNHKIFELRFPIDALLGLHWTEKEQKALQKFEGKDDVASRLRQLALIVDKLEGNKNGKKT